MDTSEYTLMRAAEDTHWWYRGLRRLTADALRRHGVSSHARVLDAGCGTGGSLAFLKLEQQAAAIDLNANAIALCRTRGIARLTQGSVAALPFRDGLFDTVLCLDVLYHASAGAPAATLRELARVLAPGGILILNVPAYAWLRSGHDSAIHTAHRFTRSETAALLRQCGLEIHKITYWNTLLFPAVATLRLLHRKGHDSDLAAAPGPLEQAVGSAALALERILLQFMALPFGLSVFAVARKPRALDRIAPAL